MAHSPDAVVIGAGPNGLAAAIALAQGGLKVLVLEASDVPGGGARSAQNTLPGFTHDVCSAIHPLTLGSPFFRTLGLERFGLEWVQPDAPVAHPLDVGDCVMLERSVEATAEGLDAQDRAAYVKLLRPIVAAWQGLDRDLLGPLVRMPRHPFAMARLGVNAVQSVRGFCDRWFHGKRARALFAGLAGHSMLRMEQPGSASFALVLAALGHAIGWPMPRGGAQGIANALVRCLESLGGSVETGRRVNSLDELPAARVVLCDLSPKEFLRIGGARVPSRFRRLLGQYRYAPGAYKVDWALSAPVPWRAGGVRRAATVHIGGTLEEISESETAVWNGKHAHWPYMILAQHTLFDQTRAPAGQHTLWGYCHVPNGSTFPMMERMESQIERFAPGFRETVLARAITTPADYEAHNPNIVGGDINNGVQDLYQMVVRPTLALYGTPLKGVYLCSAATPPGGGVHGMCGYLAAQRALRHLGRG